MKIRDSVAIVTGASSGIGLATARLLTKNGAKVALVARSKDVLSNLEKELADSFAVVADMSKSEQIKAMVRKVYDHYGRIDILINNAGQGYDAPVEKINIDTWHKVFDLDIVGPVIAMQQVIPIMRKEGNGVIVNISSGTALMYLPNMSAYSSLKRALAAISLTAREELKDDGISVGVVFPYVTATKFEENTIKDGMPDEEWDGSGLPHPIDPPEYAAEKILEGIRDESAEIYAHDWMQRFT